MAHSPLHQFSASDEDDRKSRFAPSNGFESAGTRIIGRGSGTLGGGGSTSLRERAASQPPHSSDSQNFLSSPSATQFIPASLGGGTLNNQWPNSRLSSNNRGNQPIPVRSSSFSTTSQSQFSSAMRDRVFPSMFEDEEDYESDTYDERYIPPALGRGRSYGDPTRSRSQSLATGRPGPIGSSYLGSSTMNSWTESGSSPLAIPGRFGEIKPPGQSRYGSLGTLGRSPSNLLSSSPSANLLGNGLNMRGISETNQSPFRRDVGQILLDDGSAFRELWAGMNPPRDENGGGGSGTTSRRHSVSVVQPRRGVVGFNAPETDGFDEPLRSGGGFGRRTGPKLTDDELALDLGNMNLGLNEPSLSSSSTNPPSQPASLPIYAPLSRSPPSRDLLSPYQTMNNLGMPGSFNSRQSMGTPSEHEFAAERESPSRFDQYPQYGQQDSTARFVPGQGFSKYSGTGASSNQAPYLRNREPSFSSNAPPPGLTSPISPTSGTASRLISPQQQQSYYPQPIQRKLSEPLSPLSATSANLSQPPSASINLTNPPLPGHGQHQQQGSQGSSHSVSGQPNLNDLGKGVPLHSVPPTCPLFIVEFKAGRTDLFYLTNPSLNVKMDDLVIVEADRGKDLGRVVNDTITIGQVEEWQRQQTEKANSAAMAAAAAASIGFGLDSPLSPTGGSGAGAGQGGVVAGGAQGVQPAGKKEINPKMILGKADQNDSHLLAQKAHDELKALQLCQSKVKSKKLPMEVIDAEYQWDRRKLTFYFIAEKRIDFRELVRELFRLYKTRIWMASIQGGGVSYEQ